MAFLTKEHKTDLHGFKINNKEVMRLMTPSNYAKILGITPKAVYGRIKKETIPYCIIGGVYFVIIAPLE